VSACRAVDQIIVIHPTCCTHVVIASIPGELGRSMAEGVNPSHSVWGPKCLLSHPLAGQAAGAGRILQDVEDAAKTTPGRLDSLNRKTSGPRTG